MNKKRNTNQLENVVTQDSHGEGTGEGRPYVALLFQITKTEKVNKKLRIPSVGKNMRE
jgi:hypothetical protein